MSKAVSNYLRNLLPVIWLGAVVGVMGYSFIHGGEDWILMYRPTTLTGFSAFPAVANPTYILLIFYPLAMLPSHIGAALIVGSVFLSA